MTLTAPWGYDGNTYHGKDVSLALAAATGKSYGVASYPDFAVTQQASPAGSVLVATGSALVPANGTGLFGSFAISNDAPVTVAVTPTGGTSRCTLIILEVSSGTSLLTAVDGPTDGTNNDPSLSSHHNYIVLARIIVPASTTNITNAMISDVRVLRPSSGPLWYSAAIAPFGEPTPSTSAFNLLNSITIPALGFPWRASFSAQVGGTCAAGTVYEAILSTNVDASISSAYQRRSSMNNNGGAGQALAYAYVPEYRVTNTAGTAFTLYLHFNRNSGTGGFQIFGDAITSFFQAEVWPT